MIKQIRNTKIIPELDQQSDQIYVPNNFSFIEKTQVVKLLLYMYTY
ncbi:hypothetical protein RZE82_05085 [Mollicutes bacterium LVI A0039]|nr:hypothetical protein RZE82_05085 [Mollicutes bacterium LVI A0039]